MGIRAIGVFALLGLCGCAPAAPAPTVHEVMAGIVAPQAQVLWDITNRSMDDEGVADASKLSAADWAALAAASRNLHRAAMSLASLERPTVVAPGQKIEDEDEAGASTGAQVQGFVDADRPAFRARAAALERIAGDFLASVEARDAERVLDRAGQLDGVCEACHLQFWYPQDAAAR